MTYITIAQPILLIIVVLTAGIFLGFFSFIFTFKKERSELEKNIQEFDKNINKFETRTGALENDRLNERPRRATKQGL
tara:strand:+ start:100 stop:333 length:234 start_codon:yes stop_codon:yes gene_type:complete